MFWARRVSIKREEDLHVSDSRIQVDLQNVLVFNFFNFFPHSTGDDKKLGTKKVTGWAPPAASTWTSGAGSMLGSMLWHHLFK